MNKFYILLIVFFISGCANFNYVVFPKTYDFVKIEDGISREEGKQIVKFVSNNYDDFFSDDSDKGSSYQSIDSISKWRTPGKPTETELKCLYSVNIGHVSHCIGINESSKEKELKLLFTTVVLV